MSLSLGAMIGLGAAASGASSGANLMNDFIGSWASSSAKQSLNKSIMKTNYKIQKQYDLWTQEQDKLYEQWYQNFMYGLQNNEYFNLAKKYATNTASWAVEGLKRAGLNPILAGIDSNLSSSMGNANPSGSGHKVGGGSIHGAAISSGTNPHSVDLAGALQKATAAEQARLQTDIAKETKPDVVGLAHSQAVNAGLTSSQISASTAESLARAKLIDAQAAKVQVDTVNAERNSGLSGISGGLVRSAREIGDAIDRTMHNVGHTLQSGVKIMNGYSDDGSARYPKPPVIRILHDGEKAFLPPEKPIDNKPVPKYKWGK